MCHPPPLPQNQLRRGAVLLVLAGVWLIPCLLAQASDSSSTLPELVRSALATDERIARADSKIRRARADRKLTSSALLPQLNLYGNWTRYGEEQVLEFAPGESFELRPLADWNWSADLQQTLFYGLRDWRARDVARLRQDIARLERYTAAADLTLEVSYAFLEAVASEQRVDLSTQALEQVQEQQRVAERRFEVGEVARADVARWRSQVAAEKLALVVAEGSRDLARRRLARLTGIRELGTLRPPGPVPVPSGELDTLVSTAIEDRFEMEVIENQLESAGLMIKIEKGALLPELKAVAQYFQQKAEFPSQDWLSISLNLSVPVYDGGFTAARVAGAREDLVEVQLLQSRVAKEIADQVDAAAIRHRSAVAGYDAAVERQEAAAEAYRQTETAYRVGEASATDLLTTTTERIDAETTLIIARWQREFEAIALRHAVGEQPLPDLDLKNTEDFEQ